MKSPYQLDNLNLTKLPKGSEILCHFCHTITKTGVEMYLAENDRLICPECADNIDDDNEI